MERNGAPAQCSGIRGGGLRVIEKGLKKGDRVVLTGIQRLRPGTKVEVTKVAMPVLAQK